MSLSKGPELLLTLQNLNLHLNPLVRKVVRPPLKRDYLIRRFHAAHHLAEDGVLPVEEIRILYDYEKLGTRAVGTLRPCHGNYPPLVGNVVELGLNHMSRAAGSVLPFIVALGQGVPALNHKTGNNPVEYGSIVKTPRRELYEVFHVLRRDVGKKLNLYLSVLGLYYRPHLGKILLGRIFLVLSVGHRCR